MAIQKIIIACYKYDVHLARICVASIRYWYPDIPLFLIKDLSRGDFSTMDLEQYWAVEVLDLERQHFGWGLSKLEAFFLFPGERLLILDADTIFLGPVLDELEKIEASFIVSGYPADAASFLVKKSYFDIHRLQRIDPDYRFPGFVFNTGQMVVTGGILSRADFRDWIQWSDPPKLLWQDVFRNADQGLLNYLMVRKKQEGELELYCHLFHHWIGSEAASTITLQQIEAKAGVPFILHWAGCQHVLISKMPRHDLLAFFENRYYDAVPNGASLLKKDLVRRKWLYRRRWPSAFLSKLLHQQLRPVVKRILSKWT